MFQGSKKLHFLVLNLHGLFYINQVNLNKIRSIQESYELKVKAKEKITTFLIKTLS